MVEMLSQLGCCADEDTEVDSQLGYPHVYAKLCRHALAVELPMPFSEGAPQRFLPYAPQAEDFIHLKDWDNVFPIIAERERDSSHTRKYAEELWQQLDHLGNAGFDPAKFRVDPYGNVVYWNADPSSPLAWDIDHWFPFPRGGKSVLPNLRIVQWQACSRKRNRLEFLVPWWDLLHGCSINQFLSAFAAKNADFRKRSFALFFAGGEDEAVAREHVGECRPWPQQFREKKALCGLAAAAIVSVSKDIVEVAGDVGGPSSKDPTSSDVSRILGAYPYGAIHGTAAKRVWSAEEEEALKRGVSKFGPGSWKEIREGDVALANRSVAQIKEKFRLMRGVPRNATRESSGAGKNGLSRRQSAATTALQKELRVKIMREEERREREEELAKLEETVTRLKLENEKERLKAAELDSLLKKHKHRVERQRKLAESQSSYRLCLERVLRDTMHQTMSYKEQARVTREACNVLIARLDSQKASCEDMEHELLQRHSQREVLEAAAGGSASSDRTALMLKQLATQGRDLVDVSSCVSLRVTGGDEDDNDDDNDDDEEIEEDEEEEKLVMTANKLSESETSDDDEVYNLRREHQQARKSLVRHAIKVAMQVEDMKEAVALLPWEVQPSSVATKPPCPIPAATEHRSSKSRKGAREFQRMSQSHLLYETDSETPESECDSDFADDEMSPGARLSRDDNNNALVSDVGAACEFPTFCTRNAKPGADGDLSMVAYGFEHGQQLPATSEPAVDAASLPSAGESVRSDHSKQEVQKDVIVVQQTGSSKDVTKAYVEGGDAAGGLCKQEYLDELLQQIRFQIPTSEVTTTEETMATTTMSGGPPYISEGHLDELLEQALKTHLDNVRRNDASREHRVSADVDDEKLREIGKSNLDKWLQVLLFKDVESACSSPGRDTSPLQIVSPALSHISVAAMRESLERVSHQEFLERDGDDAERPRSLWGVLLRKLTVKHQSEQQQQQQQSLSFEPKEDYHVAVDDIAQDRLPKLANNNHDADITAAMISLLKSSPSRQLTDLGKGLATGTAGVTLAEGRDACAALPGWPGGIQLGGSASNYWPKDNTMGAIATTADVNPDDAMSATWKTERRVQDGVHVDYAHVHHAKEKRYHFPMSLSDVDELSETESVDGSPARSPAFPKEQLHSRHKKRVSIKVAGFVGWKSKSLSSKKADRKLQENNKAPALVATTTGVE